MNKYLHLDVPKSTKKEPHLYLDTMATPDYIELLKSYFFHEHKSENSFYRSFDIDVNVPEELLILNYEDSTFVSEFDPPLREWKSVTYKFEDSLELTLKVEELSFINNLDFRFDNKGYEAKSMCAFMLKLIGIISERYERIDNSPAHQKYIVLFKRFFLAIAEKIKNDYYSYLPKKFNPVFNAILSIQPDDQPLEKAYLNISIFEEIKELKDENGRFIFKIENPDTAKAKFRHIIYNEPEKVLSPIIVTANFPNISAARYLISRICFYVGISDNTLQKHNLFTLNDKPLTVNSTYTAKSRVKNDKMTVMERLDSIIYSHIK